MIRSTGIKYLRFLTLLVSLLFALFIMACGNSASETDGSNTTPVDQSSLTLTLSSNAVSFGTPVTAHATLRNENGETVSGAVVSFAAASGLVTFTPVSATALTNSSGIATITLNAASISSAGATTISAASTFESGTSTKTVTSPPVGITVNGATLSLEDITLGSSSISAYGSSSVKVSVNVDGSPATVPISVAFTSPCTAAGKATLTSPVTTVAGAATSTYKDNGCAGIDPITASVTGDSISANITVAPPATNNIQFSSATPSIIATSTASSSSLPTSSLVKFRVVDSSGSGLSGIVVDFSVIPSSKPGGLSLSSDLATTDADGYVTVTLSSGTIPTPVWVVATVDGTTLKSQSNTLTITTGLPTQNFFSLSVQTYNIEGWNYDGVTSSLMIIASDRLGNPVPDGTAINFITEGAQITPASCSTTGGTCSATFKSAESRPADGRVTILAYAIGEKSFIDSIINNSYDSGETFYDLGDPYLDTNENGIWDSGEFFIPSTTSGTAECLTQPSAAPLPSNYANVPSKENSCTAAWGQNYVRRDAVLVLSGSYAATSTTSLAMGTECSKTFPVWLYDVNNNPMPAGTVLSISSATVNETCLSTGVTAAANLSIDGGSPVLNTNNYGGTPVALTVNGCSSCSVVQAYPSGTFNLVVTTPKANVTTIPFTITGNSITPNLALEAGTPIILASTSTSITLTVTDQFANPIAGLPVAFSFVANTSGATLSATTATTNASGQAVIYYTSGATDLKTDTIMASISNGGYSQIVTIYVL